MKKLNEIALFLILIIGITGCTKKKTDIEYDKKYIKQIKEVRKEVINYLVAGNIPGGSVAISKNGKLIYSEGIGFASKELEVPVTRQTRFRIGEVSECFTAIVYQKIVETGLLNSDSSVNYYLKDFPAKKYNLKIDNLCYQTSGLRRPLPHETDWRILDKSIQEGIEMFKNDSLMYPPGVIQEVNPFNYNLLGAVMEKATGKNFSKLLKENLTDTLHLTNTLPDSPFLIIKGRSNFYDLNFVAQLINASFRDLRYSLPSEGLLSNAEDLVKLGNAMINSTVITDSIREKVLEPAILPNNMKTVISKGWIAMVDKNGRKFFGRAGGVTGGSAALIVYPDEKLVIAATFNLTDRLGQFPIMEMANKFLTQKQEVKQ